MARNTPRPSGGTPDNATARGICPPSPNVRDPVPVNQPGRNSRSEVLAPFGILQFPRFQWPADLLTSWASEMEILILGWCILTRDRIGAAADRLRLRCNTSAP